MNISITGRKVKITPELRNYIEKNMKKLDHYIDHITDFKLVLKRERQFYFAEVNLNMKRSVIHVFAKTPDVYSVIDTLYDKLEVKLRKYWEKIINKRYVPLKESISQLIESSGS